MMSPVVLYVKGEVSALTHPAIAVVGTRDPTGFGAAAAERLGANLGARGFVVVSGLALGCDTAAHEGCLQSRGVTVAVLAHGVDYVYPAKNRKLANSIVDGGGALVSEYAPGTRPRPSYFVERDRLQSALSLGVIVVETNVEGGTMHTAGFAVKQQRRLACLVHPPKFAAAEKTRGNQKLIKESGAFPLEKKEDLDAFIALVLPHKVCEAGRFHDVYYFHTAFFSEAEILHEALHTLLGAGDHVLLATNANLAALGKGGVTLQAMLSRIIRKLTTRVWIAATTFAIGVLFTMVWVVPFDRMEKTPDQGSASNLPQQREIESRDGWRRLEFNSKAFIMLPPDMRSEEQLIGDSVRYRESYSNNQLGLILIGDIVVPVLITEVRKKRAFSCNPPEIVQKDPTYSETLIQVDG